MRLVITVLTDAAAAADYAAVLSLMLKLLPFKTMCAMC